MRIQSWYNAGPASATPGQRCTSSVSSSRVPPRQRSRSMGWRVHSGHSGVHPRPSRKVSRRPRGPEFTGRGGPGEMINPHDRPENLSNHLDGDYSISRRVFTLLACSCDIAALFLVPLHYDGHRLGDGPTQHYQDLDCSQIKFTTPSPYLHCHCLTFVPPQQCISYRTCTWWPLRPVFKTCAGIIKF